MDIANIWLQSGLPALIRGGKLTPKPHPRYPHIAWYEEGKQGFCFHLIQGGNQRQWILKKFKDGMMPERNYLLAIRNLLPSGVAFSTGIKRALLTTKDVKSEDKTYNSPELTRWIEDTLLMPKVSGVSWTRVAQELRKGSYDLAQDHRIMFAKNLADAVVALEDNGCSHRDLSHQNLFLDMQEYVIYLVDWDSLFHGSLAFTRITPVGTDGYIAPWVTEKSGKIDVRKTWNAQADRFSLAILIAELLTVNADSKSYHYGTLFSQEIFKNTKHSEILQTSQSLQSISQDLADLWERTFRASNFEDCPRPKEWQNALENIPESGKGTSTQENIDAIESELEKNYEEQADLSDSGEFTSINKFNYLLLLFIILLPVVFWGAYRLQHQSVQTNSAWTTTTEYLNSLPKTEIFSSTFSKYPKQEYHLVVEYQDTDLEILVDNQKVEHKSRNEAIVKIAPAEYYVTLKFSTIVFDSKGDTKRGNWISVSNRIPFQTNSNKIKISIDRENRTWRATSF